MISFCLKGKKIYKNIINILKRNFWKGDKCNKYNNLYNFIYDSSKCVNASFILCVGRVIWGFISVHSFTDRITFINQALGITKKE